MATSIQNEGRALVVAKQVSEKMTSQSGVMEMAFWAGLALGGLSALALVATYLLKYGAGGH
jgi:hypothetical protein